MIGLNAEKPKERTKYTRRARERYNRVIEALRTNPTALPVLDVKVKLEWLRGDLRELGESV